VNEIWIDPTDDAAELVKALRAEGYVVTERRPEDESEPWALLVDAFDDGVVEMVDVYGGWLAGEA
jgi:hypothetical protein